MSAHGIAGELRRMSAETGGVIVEVGAWLGHGTAILAESGNTVHSFDRFVAQKAEVRKAREQGVELQVGQDTLPMVRSWLPDNVTLHKCKIRDIRWPGEPIGMYVDDAAKQPHNFAHVVRQFFPHLVSGAFVVLMDYGHDYCECQREYMEGNAEFEKLEGWTGVEQGFRKW